jgi:hypothetical protein
MSKGQSDSFKRSEKHLLDCKLCAVKLLKEEDFKKHLLGKKHLKMIANMKTLQLKKEEVQKTEITSKMLNAPPPMTTPLMQLNLKSSFNDGLNSNLN